MLELVQRVNWNEYLLILTQGSPPLGLQLLMVNAMLVAYWFMRRRAPRKRNAQPSGWLIPAMFAAGNISVVTWGGTLAF